MEFDSENNNSSKHVCQTSGDDMWQIIMQKTENIMIVVRLPLNTWRHVWVCVHNCRLTVMNIRKCPGRSFVRLSKAFFK